MKTAEELLMEFIGKYASHWICADDDFPKDLNKIVDAIQATRPTVSEEEISDLIHDAMLRNYNSKQLAKKILKLLTR